MDAFDDAESADRVASIANACRSQQCIGVEYIVEGPVDETVPFV